MDANKRSPGKGARRANMANHKAALARYRASDAKPRARPKGEMTRALELALRRMDPESACELYFGTSPVLSFRLEKDLVLRRIHIHFETR